MTCSRKKQILRLLQGALSPAEERDIESHIEACPECRHAASELQEVWDVLGLWEVRSFSAGVKDRILERIGGKDEYSRPSGGRRRRMLTGFRAAAAAVAVFGLGAAAGLMIPAGLISRHDEAASPFRTEQVLNVLGLDDFGVDSATGLPWELGRDPQASKEE